VLVAAGDALIRFDASQVRFSEPGLIALGCYATPEEASRHGVFCIGEGDAVSVYLQKPSVRSSNGWARSTARPDRARRSRHEPGRRRGGGPSRRVRVEETSGGGLNFRRKRASACSTMESIYTAKICCALGSAATPDQYVSSARSSGSRWTDEALGRLFPVLNRVPLHVQIVPSCRFLHFGSTASWSKAASLWSPRTEARPLANRACGQLPHSAAGPHPRLPVLARSLPDRGGRRLAGRNVLVGLDVDAPLALPGGACLEVLPGRNRAREDVWFVRCYGIRDTFKNGLFCGCALLDWLRVVGVDAEKSGPA